MRPLFFDRCIPRSQVQLMLFACELFAIIVAAVFATGALSGSWSSLGLVVCWAALPRLASRCLEWSGNAPKAPVVLAAGVGLLVIVGSYGWVQVVDKLDVAAPTLALLSGLWVSGALLFDFRVYRLHDVALFGVLISGMACDQPGSWWAGPLLLVAFGGAAALRHLLYDVYSEGTPAPINLQSSQVIGWLGGGAAAVLFLVLSGLLWWVEPGGAAGPPVQPGERAKSENENGAPGDGTDGSDSEGESTDGSDSDGESSAESATAAGEGSSEEATTETGEGEEVGSEESTDVAAEDEATADEATADVVVEPELPEEPAAGEDEGVLAPAGNLVELPELPDPIDPEEPDILGPFGGTPKRAKPGAESLVDDDKSRRVKFLYGLDELVSVPDGRDTPVGSRTAGTATGSGSTLSGNSGLSAAATARSGKSTGSGGGQRSIGSAGTTAPGLDKAAKAAGSGGSGGGEIVFNAEGKPLKRREVEKLQELPPEADDIVAMALAERARAAAEAERGDAPPTDDAAEETADESTAGIDAESGALLGPIGDGGDPSADEVAKAELLPPPSVGLDYLPDPRNTNRSVAELMPTGGGDNAGDGEDEDRDKNPPQIETQDASEGKGERNPALVWTLSIAAMFLAGFALRTFFARSPKDDRRAVAPSSGGGTLTIVPLGASVHRARRAPGSPEEAVLLAYDELQNDLARRRFQRREHETPREQRLRLVARDEQVDRPLGFVVGCVYDVLYGRYGVDPDDVAEVEASCADVRDQLVR